MKNKHFCFLLIVIFALLLSSCSSAPEVSHGTSEDLYTIDFKDPGLITTNIEPAVISKDYLISFDDDLALCVYDHSGSLLYTDELEDSTIIKGICKGREDNSLSAICYEFDDSLHIDHYLRTYNISAKNISLVSSVKLDLEVAEDYYNMIYVTDLNEYLLFDGKNKILCVDVDGKLADTIKISGAMISNILIDDTGLRFLTFSAKEVPDRSEFYMNFYNNGKMQRNKINIDLPEEFESLALIQSDSTDQACFILVGTDLYAYNDDLICKVGEAPDCRIYKTGSEYDLVSTDGLMYFCSVSAVPYSNISQLDLACLEYTDDLKKIVGTFEIFNPDIRIKVHSYLNTDGSASSVNLEDADKELTQKLHALLVDISNDNASDIDLLYLPYEQQLSLLEQDLLESYEPNAFDNYEVFDIVKDTVSTDSDNRIFPAGFLIKSLAFDPEHYSEYDNSFDSLCKMSEKYDIPIFSNVNPYVFADIIYSGLMNDSITEDDICLLTTYLQNNYDHEFPGGSLVSVPSIDSVIDYYDFILSEPDKSKIDGYPNGPKGPYMYLTNAYSILSISEQKDEAHRFIEHIYSELGGRLLEQNGVIPSNTKAANDLYLLDNMVSDIYSDSNDLSGLTVGSYEAVEKRNAERKKAILDQKDKLTEGYFKYINSAQSVICVNDLEMSIIYDELNDLLSEGKDPKETAKQIVNRTKTYFDENRRER